MGADSLPFDPARVAMGQVEAAGVWPIDAEFVLMTACGDVAMAARPDIGIYSDGGWGTTADAGSFFD